MRLRSGFTLLELSVSLVVMGLLAGLFLQFKQSDATDCNAVTKVELTQVEHAMHEFVIAHDRFPVPSLRTAGVEDMQFGREAPLASLDAAGGIVFGALPFQALGLAPSFAGDCWGNKFTYAVTANLTDSAKFKKASAPYYLGTITVKGDAGTTLNSAIAYAVISHGADGVGAVKLNYSDASNTNRRWCQANAVIETANCSAAAPLVVAATFNNGKDAGATLFDDLVIFGGKEQRIVNGQCDNSFALGCAKGSVSNDNGATACSTTRTWHCDGANGGTNDTSCNRANPVCSNCASTSLTWGGGCSGTFPATNHGATSAPATANVNPSFTAASNASASCTNGVFATPVGTCTPIPTPVAGVCNNAVPLGCLAAGPAASDNGQTSCGTTRTWICSGQYTGPNSPPCSFTNAACIDCPAQNLGWGGGCSSSFPQTTNGSTTVPVTNTNPTFTGTATAICTNGVLTANGTCTPLVPINGSCDNSGSAPACVAGTVSNDNGDTTAGNTRTWHCDSPNGGTDDTNCSYVNPNECTAGWSTEYLYSEEAPYDMNAYDFTVGFCTAGLGGRTPSTTGRVDDCISHKSPGKIFTRACGAPQCIPDGTPVPELGGSPGVYIPAYCCSSTDNGGSDNGDSDNDHICGTQSVCNPSSVTNGTVGAYPACAITCNAGYTLNGSICVATGCRQPMSIYANRVAWYYCTGNVRLLTIQESNDLYYSGYNAAQYFTQHPGTSCLAEADYQPTGATQSDSTETYFFISDGNAVPVPQQYQTSWTANLAFNPYPRQVFGGGALQHIDYSVIGACVN